MAIFVAKTCSDMRKIYGLIGDYGAATPETCAALNCVVQKGGVAFMEGLRVEERARRRPRVFLATFRRLCGGVLRV